MADVPTAAGVHAPDDLLGDGWLAGAGSAAEGPEDWYRASQAADARGDARAGAEAWYAPVPGVRGQVGGVRQAAGGARRAVAVRRCCCRALALALRPARAWSAVTLAAVPADDPVHATRVAALRRDSRRGGRATAGKIVFPSLLFPLRYLENVESVCRSRGKTQKGSVRSDCLGCSILAAGSCRLACGVGRLNSVRI